jgi:hypothetical protein
MDVFWLVVQLIAGSFLLWWGVPHLLRLARSLPPLKRNTDLPKSDALSEWQSITGRCVGVIVGMLLMLAFYIFKVPGAAFCILLGMMLGEWLAEQLSLQPLQKGHPWRAIPDDMARRLGIDAGEVYYRQCDESVPYPIRGGIVLPSRVLRDQDDAMLQFAVIQALAARKQPGAWLRIGASLPYGIAAAFFAWLRHLWGEAGSGVSVLTTITMVLWLRSTTVYHRRKDDYQLDQWALDQIKDFEAARQAIELQGISPQTYRRIAALREWWKNQQAVSVLKVGTPAALQPSNTQQSQSVKRIP